MSNLELRIEEEASLDLTLGESSDMSFDAVDFVGVPFAPTVEVEDIEGGHRVSITSMGAEGKKTDEFDVMDGEDAATWLSGNVLFGELAEGSVLTADDAYAAPPKNVEVYGKSTQAGTPTPDAPVPILSVDDLTLHVCGKNLFDATTWIEDGRIPSADTGALVPSSVSHRSGLMQLDAGTYTYSLVNGYANGPKYVHAYDSNGTWLRTLVARNAEAIGTTFSVTFNVTSDVAYVCIVSQIADTQPQLELGSTATAYAPYVGQSIPIPLSNHELRSLPNGTRDTLTLSYVAPSTEHEGWGVYSKTLEQRVEHVVLDGSGTENYYVDTAGTYNRNNRSVIITGKGWIDAGYPAAANRIYAAMCDKLEAKKTKFATWTTPGISGWVDDTAPLVLAFSKDVAFSDQATFKTWLASYPLTIDYQLATPQTYDLGTVELPILPNPLTAWADGGSAQPTLSMSYEQDINIVIGELRNAIADMATS